jgi:hypothetical protein
VIPQLFAGLRQRIALRCEKTADRNDGKRFFTRGTATSPQALVRRFHEAEISGARGKSFCASMISPKRACATVQRVRCLFGREQLHSAAACDEVDISGGQAFAQSGLGVPTKARQLRHVRRFLWHHSGGAVVKRRADIGRRT